jgi:hypothetical protein
VQVGGQPIPPEILFPFCMQCKTAKSIFCYIQKDREKVPAVWTNREGGSRAVKTLGVVIDVVGFSILTSICGKKIEKREWGEAVWCFLIALGTILYLVKVTPPF